MIIEKKMPQLYTPDLYKSTEVVGRFNAIILKNQSSEDVKSGTLRKLRKIKTSQILVVFSKTLLTDIRPRSISILSHIYIYAGVKCKYNHIP